MPRVFFMAANSAATILLLMLCVSIASAERDPVVPTGPLPPGLEPLRYRLSFDLDPRRDGFAGKAEIDIRLDSKTRRIFLHGLDLEVQSVRARTASGRELDGSYAQLDASGVSALAFERNLPRGETTLTIEYRAKYSRQPLGLHRIDSGAQSFLFTQHEAIEARRSFPGFDEPRFKVPFEVSVIAPHGQEVVSNSTLALKEDIDREHSRWRFAPTLPLPTYLLFLAVGPFEVVEAPALPATALRPRAVPLRAIVLPGRGEKTRQMLDATRFMLEDLETYFDTPYPYPKLDLVASPDYPGAMENAGAIFYGESTLLLDDNSSLEQLRGVAETHAHELAHQWVGDLVTPKWWDSIWLNESFAQWMGTRTADRWRADLRLQNAIVQDALYAMGNDARASARAIAEPVTRNAQIQSSFDSITYAKGGAVLEMFSRYLGEQRFREGVRLHMRRFAHGVADTGDFMRSLADGAGDGGVLPAFRSFIEQSGLPQVEVSLSCEEDQPKIGLRQSRYLPLGTTASSEQHWQIPVCLELGSDGGTSRRCLMLTDRETDVTLDAGSACPRWIHPNAGGSGYYRFTLDEASWRALTHALDDLDEASALSAVNNFSAAWLAGKISARTLIDGLERVAMLPMREAALDPRTLYRMIEQQMLGESARAGFRNWLSARYAPRLAAIGYEEHSDTGRAEAAETELWRSGIAELLVQTARDADLSAELATRAQRLLAGERPGALSRDAIDPALISTALIAGVRLGGRAFFDALLEDALASGDTVFRQQAMAALASTVAPELAQRVRTLILDPRIGSVESFLLAVYHSRVPETRQELMLWLQQHVDELAQRLERFGRSNLPWLGAMGCSAEDARRLSAIFESRAAALYAERSLTQTLESIDLCIARRAALAGELETIFAAR